MNQKGFSLVELTIILAVMATLAAAAGVAAYEHKSKLNRDLAISRIGLLHKANQFFYDQYCDSIGSPQPRIDNYASNGWLQKTDSVDPLSQSARLYAASIKWLTVGAESVVTARYKNEQKAKEVVAQTGAKKRSGSAVIWEKRIYYNPKRRQGGDKSLKSLVEGKRCL